MGCGYLFDDMRCVFETSTKAALNSCSHTRVVMQSREAATALRGGGGVRVEGGVNGKCKR